MNSFDWESILLVIREHEIEIHKFIQNKIFQPLWTLMYSVFDTSVILDMMVPVLACYLHQCILDKLIFFLAMVNLFSSLIKWSLPEYRPSWWLRELPSNQQHLKELTIFPQGCETSSGFPTTTILLWMTLVYVILQFSNHRTFSKIEKCLKYSVFVMVLGLIWIGSLYLLTEFLHQCILTTLSVWFLLQNLEKMYPLLSNLKRIWFVTVIVLIGTLPFVVYVGKLKMGIDPHWSVRMAFKWCDNRNYLRYETSPIFSLARDFGYLMGFALSTSVITKRKCSTNTVNRKLRKIIFLGFLETLNYFCRQETPKQHGRFVFVGYEFLRNLIHSYSLLILFPKLTS